MKLLIFDTETTGLPESRDASVLSTHMWPYIVQLAYILYDTNTNSIIEYNDSLIKIHKNVYITPDSIAVHNITKDMCNKNGIDIKEALNKFNDVLFQADILIGHNLQFDKNILLVEFLRNKIMHNFNSRNIPKQSFCTMENGISICNLTYKTRNGNILPKYPKLLELFKHFFNETPEGLHNAMTDVIVTLRCYYKMQFNMDIFDCSLDIKNLKDLYLK
jgi:DNA polymerase III epsilon subunit-like protein